ncbi:MAG TPA: glutamate cyclase domain-containing protein, partial [Reyranella sp.]
WRGADISHAIAIERCGRSADGKPRNMRGVDVGQWTAPLDDVFLGGPWAKLAVGDGGNEIGMGKLPPGLIARTVPNGAQIACVTSCDHLVVAGVSNWGAYGLMAALAVLRPDWSTTIAGFLTAERDLAVTRATVDKAGAVDGVTAEREATVDGFGPEIHGPLVDELGRIARGQAAD